MRSGREQRGRPAVVSRIGRRSRRSTPDRTPTPSFARSSHDGPAVRPVSVRRPAARSRIDLRTPPVPIDESGRSRSMGSAGSVGSATVGRMAPRIVQARWDRSPIPSILPIPSTNPADLLDPIDRSCRYPIDRSRRSPRSLRTVLPIQPISSIDPTAPIDRSYRSHRLILSSPAAVVRGVRIFRSIEQTCQIEPKPFDNFEYLGVSNKTVESSHDCSIHPNIKQYRTKNS